MTWNKTQIHNWHMRGQAWGFWKEEYLLATLNRQKKEKKESQLHCRSPDQRYLFLHNLYIKEALFWPLSREQNRLQNKENVQKHKDKYSETPIFLRCHHHDQQRKKINTVTFATILASFHFHISLLWATYVPCIMCEGAGWKVKMKFLSLRSIVWETDR